MRELYDALARQLPGPDPLFLNYGYAEPRASRYRWIRPADRRHKYHLSLIRHLVGRMNLTGKKVLEVSSGRGGNCYYLSQYTAARKVVGLDLCRGNVEACAKDRRLVRVQFVQGDAQRLPFAAKAFDLVLNLESSHCYPDFARFLSEVSRVLKPGGHFCYADVWYVDVLPIDWKRREATLAAAKLRVISEEDISEQVFRALAGDDGLTRWLHDVETPQNRWLIARLVQTTGALRACLASGQCSYKLWRFRNS